MPTPKRYPLSSSLFFDTPLALLPAKRDEILAFWNAKLLGLPIDVSAYQSDETVAQQVTTIPSRGGNVAVIPLYGVISQRVNLVSEMSGGTSTEQFASALREQIANPDVKAIIIDIDSPGGSAFGLTELADIIYGARGQKPMIGQVNSLDASAAYWISSQFDELVVTPGARIGHIGVATLHIDQSQALADQGLKPYLITAGKYKSEQSIGSDLVPPTQDALDHLQADVNEAYDRFVSAVARGRGVTADQVMNGFGEGRVLSARESIRQKLADRVGTLEQTIQRVSSGGGQRRTTSSATLAFSKTFSLITEALPIEDDDERDDEQEGDSSLQAGAVPPADYGKAPESEAWSRPTLADFTDETDFGALSEAERMRIARHAVWSDPLPPERFGDIGGFHHRPAKTGVGPAVWRGVSSGRMEQASWSNDSGVRDHRAFHYRQFGKPVPWEKNPSGNGSNENNNENSEDEEDTKEKEAAALRERHQKFAKLRLRHFEAETEKVHAQLF